MRQITERICTAFEQRRTLKIDNSETNGNSLWLFGNKIAEWREDGIWITDAGWKTKNTKERLNGLTGVSISQRAGSWYINGNLWQGEWTSVNENNGIIPTQPEVVEFDLTSEWIPSGNYSKPIYSAFHTTNKEQLNSVYRILNEEDISFRMVEGDTAGEYKPNYFVVVKPKKLKIAQSLINNKI